MSLINTYYDHEYRSHAHVECYVSDDDDDVVNDDDEEEDDDTTHNECVYGL